MFRGQGMAASNGAMDVDDSDEVVVVSREETEMRMI